MQQILTASQLLTGPTDRQFAPGALLIDGGKIAAVGTPSEVERHASPTADRYDYPDATILPGLINCHVHLAFDASPDPVSALQSSSDDELLAAMQQRAHEHLFAGVTTVRDLGDRRGLITSLRDAIKRGESTGPRILAAGAPVTPKGGHCWFLGGEVDSAESIRANVRHNARIGTDLIKIMGNGGQMTPGGPGMTDAQFTSEQLRLITSEARAAGLPAAVHAYTTDAIAAAVEAGVATVEHCTFHGNDGAAALDDDLADRMALDGVAASPALPSGWRRMWDMLGPQRAEAIADRLRWLRRHDVPLIFGSDAGVPISQHGDPVSTLELYEHIGFPQADIIELATTTSARHIGLGDVTGEIRPGLDADVVVANGDPTRGVGCLRHLRRVLRAGIDSW
ncbi:amidohydrolase family protein [Saccharopolyspora sp. NFXS83]|uniref:amidohydrolase family protein n=1 Tax=Saccharopolyspora sp. NFXS83 TaxID=2993560 RepID=UPI00224B9035|nr:amidohydrolase family protein [Saccharopolyspora sp. NFXS83]MCX2729452.1 amidohydrolase family protein [Saccharopolyspora sp. NFXS83]